jgi:hypothetical protein
MLIKELNGAQYLMTYVRDEHKNPQGVLLAIKDDLDRTVDFGWSLVGKDKSGKAKDSFNKEYGQFIAFKRLEGVGYFKNLPKELETKATKFIADAKDFFTKNDKDTLTFNSTISLKP